MNRLDPRSASRDSGSTPGMGIHLEQCPCSSKGGSFSIQQFTLQRIEARMNNWVGVEELPQPLFECLVHPAPSLFTAVLIEPAIRLRDRRVLEDAAPQFGNAPACKCRAGDRARRPPRR